MTHSALNNHYLPTKDDNVLKDTKVTYEAELDDVL